MSFSCEYCGSNKNVEFTEDPYDADINDDHSKHFICGDCYEKAADDI